ncbi:beta-ribofuranosylaminobenzene 5'-phosphate synthase family protein [Methylocystis parvus]|uniref:GHMP kinase n=1 Tax=Methylocystis parvus TaxID=134 RepID=A0A6B8LYM9_9HYPH|nr:beta-ribofuranosylaminobenzene 5'-phosphate synthase family protein [Methylocystis parvus]QGM96574.1 GHMP kinase [Methylocystis parvus]WBJ99572.1 GHMP kinase [Methylocystis parvus OBBP]
MSAQVRVAATARLHLGFLDMNGGLGRKFGGLGLSLDGPATRLTLTKAPANSVSGPEAARGAQLLEKAQTALVPQARHALTIHDAIPAHSGFGSGTQLALAVAAALRRLEDLDHDPAADAALMSRGARSGLGAGLFATGGVVVDGGRGPLTRTPPVIARAEFPPDWRILVIRDPADVGLHGADEKEAFVALPPSRPEESGELCRLVLMQALPALAETDLAAFGAAVARIQEIVGDYFAPRQGGRRFASAKVENAVARLMREGATGGGQTSWGPTGFAFVESETAALAILARVEAEARASGLEITAHKGLNRGARIDAVYADIA